MWPLGLLSFPNFFLLLATFCQAAVAAVAGEAAAEAVAVVEEREAGVPELVFKLDEGQVEGAWWRAEVEAGAAR